MKHDTKPSGNVSAPTSSAAAAKKEAKDYDPALDPAVADGDLSDIEYLRRQAERAKLAISHTAKSMQQSLMGGGKQASATVAASFSEKKEQTVRKHPWAILGVAGITGFVAAVFLSPNRYRNLRSRLNKLEERFARKPKPDGKRDGKSSDSEASHAATAAKASIFSSIGSLALREGWKAVEPIAMQHVNDWLSKARAVRTGEATPEQPASPKPATSPYDPRITPGGKATVEASAAT